jgi:hypothetical protein
MRLLTISPISQFAIPLLSTLIVGCGSDKVTGPHGQDSPSYVKLQSDAGDFIGGGKSYEYTPANAMLQVTASGALLSVTVEGDEEWRGDFQLPNTLNKLQAGRTAISRHFRSTARRRVD